MLFFTRVRAGSPASIAQARSLRIQIEQIHNPRSG